MAALKLSEYKALCQACSLVPGLQPHAATMNPTNGKLRTWDCFVSYGRGPEVTPWVTAPWEALEAEGIRTWLDAKAIPAGCDWHEEIGKGIVGSCARYIRNCIRYFRNRIATSIGMILVINIEHSSSVVRVCT